MAKSPHKIVRYLVWSTASTENKEDILVAFDELFEDVYEKFGPVYAHLWSVGQALKSLPYGWVLWVLKIGTLLIRIGS